MKGQEMGEAKRQTHSAKFDAGVHFTRRGKGKRSGLRVIYFWWSAGSQFWLFTLYDKDTTDDLTAKERATLKDMLKFELARREV